MVVIGCRRRRLLLLLLLGCQRAEMHNSTRDALLYEPLLLLCGPTNDTKIRVQKKKSEEED